MTDLLQTAKWFLARSDVEAASRLLAEVDGSRDLRAYMVRYWPQYFVEDAYAKVYETAGKIEAEVPGEPLVYQVQQQWRLQTLHMLMRNYLKQPVHVLDFGCSRGVHAINLHNWMPEMRFTLLDIDALSIQQAKRIVENMAKHQHMFSYAVGNEADVIGKHLFVPSQFDAVMLLEILEHVRDWRVLIEKAESLVKPGGWVFASVPSGPVELSMWHEHPERLREHVREFTADDLEEIFYSKPGFMLQYASYGLCRHTSMLNGCFVFAYQISKSPIVDRLGDIDWTRKLSTARRFNGDLPGWS